MLARQRAAGIHAGPHDFRKRLVHPLGSLRVAPVKADVRVQVAVACMEDVADQQIMTPPDGAYLVQHHRQLAARYHRVLHGQVRGHPAHRTERLLPTLPEPCPIVGSGGGAHGAPAESLEQRSNHVRIGFDRLGRPIQFNDQDRGGVGGVPCGVDGRLDSLDADLIHHLECGRDDAGPR